MYGDYYTSYDYSTSAEEAVGLLGIIASMGIFFILISMAVSIFLIVCNWKMFEKAGEEGWKSIIPVYNIVVMLQIAGLPVWYIALMLVPIANIYVTIKLNLELARKFGKSDGFAVGLILLQPIFIAILAFDKNSVYVGTKNQQNGYQQNGYQQNNVKYCQNCGTPNSVSAQFCAKCGTQI